jgi:hypothetical protein
MTIFIAIKEAGELRYQAAPATDSPRGDLVDRHFTEEHTDREETEEC